MRELNPSKEKSMTHLIWAWLVTIWSWFTPDRLIAIATIVYVFVAIMMFFSIRSQARAAHRQADIADRAAKAAEKAAIAATKSAEVADKALRATEKAVLTVVFQKKDFTLTSVPVAPFRVINTGQTRAFVKEYIAGIYISKKLPPIPLQFPPGSPTSDDISPIDARRLTAEMIGGTSISPTEMEQIVRGETVLYVAGKVSYYDEFGKSHFTVFTRKYDPIRSALVRPMEPGYNYSDQT
jgi:hypothetical protein